MKFLRGDNAGDMKKIYKSSIQRLLFFFLTLAIQIYIIILAILQFKNYFLLFLCGVIFSTPIYKIIAEGKIGNSIYGKAFLSIILLLLTLSSLLYILMGSYNPFLYFMF